MWAQLQGPQVSAAGAPFWLLSLRLHHLALMLEDEGDVRVHEAFSLVEFCEQSQHEAIR
jgi:hypothetical protein